MEYLLKPLFKVAKIERRTTGLRSGDTLQRAAPGHRWYTWGRRGAIMLSVSSTIMTIVDKIDDYSICTHSPWRRCKDEKITFDTIFGCYLPRGTIIDGSQKCRIGAFWPIAKNSGEMLKKGLKTGRNGVNFFLRPHTCWIITFVAFFYFQYFSFWYL